MKLPKLNLGKIRAGIRPGSVIIDKKTKEKVSRKKKHKKLDTDQEK